MRATTLTLCFMSCTVAFSQAPGIEPAPDRSAEAQLRKVFEGMAGVKSLQARIERSSRENRREPWMPEGSIDLIYEAGKGFSVESCSSWGEQYLFVSNQKVQLNDPFDLSQGVYLKDPKSTIFESDAALAMRGGSSTPLYYFLAGVKGFDEIVDRKGEITAPPSGSSLQSIRFKSTRLGTVTIYFDPKHKNLLVHRFEFDNLDYRKELAKLYADWGAEEPEDPLDVHEITYQAVGRKIKRDAFRTDPPKGVLVQDQRKSSEKGR